MSSILRIDGPASVCMNEYVSLRAIVDPAMDAVHRRRLKWTLSSGADTKSYEGEQIRHLVPRGATSVRAQVRTANETPLTRAFNVAGLIDQPDLLAGIVKLSPIPEQIAPQTFPQNSRPYFYAAVGSGPMLLVGRLYQPKNSASLRRGIYSSHTTSDAVYSATDYAGLGHWTRVIEPTVRAEGEGSFTAINTYDLATFTFGLIQFGAHTYGQNFHKLFYKMLASYPDLVSKYFPEFRVQQVDGRMEIYGRAAGAWKQLTSPIDKRNNALRTFIKPDPNWVTSSEISLAARLIVATRVNPELRSLQVALSKESGIAILLELHRAGASIDGQPDFVCAWIFDIRNQGRGGAQGNSLIKAALSSGDPVAELRKIGAADGFSARIAAVDKYVEKYRAEGVFEQKKFNVNTGDFEPI